MNFLSGGKVTASYLTEDKYIFQPVACYVIPQLTGFYALVLQINPKLAFISQFVNKIH